MVQHNHIRHNQKGFALVGLLCMMLLLAVTAVAINRSSGLQARRTANQTRVAQNYLGEVAAVEHSVWNLLQNPTWRTAAGGEDYTEFINGERPAAGMLIIKEEWGQVPPHWAIYFAVGNCDQTLDKAKNLGGKIEVPPMEVENVGRFAILMDPQGGHFAVIQLHQAEA